MGKAAAIPAVAGAVGSVTGGGGGGGKKGGKGGAQQSVETRLDPRAEQFRNMVFQRAQQVSQQPFQPFTGQRIAGLDPSTLAGFQGQIGGFGGLVPNLGFGQDILQQQAGFTPEQRIAQFQDPFQEQVIGGLQEDFRRQNIGALNELGSRARAGGAFGGSRQGLAEGVALGELGRQQGNVLAGVRSGGFQQAVQNAFQQQQQQQGLAGQLTNLGLTGLQGQVSGQLGLGGQRQQIEQAQRDVQFQEFLRQINQPLQNLQALQGTLAGAPFGQTTTEFAQGNPLAGLLGTGLQLGGSIAGLFGGGGGASLPPGVFDPQAGGFG